MSPWLAKKLRRTREAARLRAKRSVEARARARLGREIDADTVRYRALEDRRGQLALGFWIPLPDGLRQVFELRHAMRGRTDQYEIWTDGHLLAVGGWRRIHEWIHSQCLRAPATKPEKQLAA